MSHKPVVWLGSSREAVRAFPEAVRELVGHELFLVQGGLPPSDWRPMPSVGAGVIELRIHAGQEFRVLYVTRFAEAVVVLHAFVKRTRQTRGLDIELAGRRFREFVRLPSR